MLIVTRTSTEWPDDAAVEVVERKGLGHPDTLCDAIAERVCNVLCRAYLEQFGAILHHNVDKVLLCGGTSHPRFGGGTITAPIEIYLAGRATKEWRGAVIPVDELAIAACRELLGERLRLHEDIRVISRIRPGSSELGALSQRGELPLANDTACGVGCAPLSELEQTVLEVTRTLASPSVHAEHPAIGSDVKVMAVRYRDRVDLTVACAMIDRYLESFDAYVAERSYVKQLAGEAARRVSQLPATVLVNAADDDDDKAVFLTVTGSSAEAADDGEAGRGNRVSGLITPCRPMTIEATAGKNPVSHVGKLYNVIAGRVAHAVVTELPETGSAACMLVSRIGARIDQPALVDVAIASVPCDRVRGVIQELVRAELASLPRLRADLLAERTRLY